MKLSILVFVVTCACVWSVCSGGRNAFSLASFLSFDPNTAPSGGDSRRMYDRSSDQLYQDIMDEQGVPDGPDSNTARRRSRGVGGRVRGTTGRGRLAD